MRAAAAGHVEEVSLLSHLQVGGEPPPGPRSVRTLLRIDQKLSHSVEIDLHCIFTGLALFGSIVALSVRLRHGWIKSERGAAAGNYHSPIDNHSNRLPTSYLH